MLLIDAMRGLSKVIVGCAASIAACSAFLDPLSDEDLPRSGTPSGGRADDTFRRAELDATVQSPTEGDVGAGATTDGGSGAAQTGATDAGVDQATPAPRTLATNIADAIAFGTSVVGTKFAPWNGGPIPQGAPFWAMNAPPPSAAVVKAQSANAPGLVNLMLRAVGKPIPSDLEAGTGGTGAYGRFYAKVAKPFDINIPYPGGTLVGRKYYGIDDQGTVGVILDDGRVLQSTSSAGGVNTSQTLIQAHAANRYDYAVVPQDWLKP